MRLLFVFFLLSSSPLLISGKPTGSGAAVEDQSIEGFFDDFSQKSSKFISDAIQYTGEVWEGLRLGFSEAVATAPASTTTTTATTTTTVAPTVTTTAATITTEAPTTTATTVPVTEPSSCPWKTVLPVVIVALLIVLAGLIYFHLRASKLGSYPPIF